MSMEVIPASPEEVRAWRELHRREMNCQIVLDSWHARGWTDPYLLRLNGRPVGYGLLGGRDQPRSLIMEFYVLPPHRGAALPLFHEWVAASHATSIECQTNDPLLTLMCYDCATNIQSNVILFHDCMTSHLASPGGEFRRTVDADREKIAAANLDTDATWIIEQDGCVIAAGGILFHYNPPYGDIFMGVAQTHRRRGFGAYLIQELKRTCYEMGKIPAARCNVKNAASRATIQKAGMLPCGRVLTGAIVVGG